jgi:hypothetical protein
MSGIKARADMQSNRAAHLLGAAIVSSGSVIPVRLASAKAVSTVNTDNTN